MTEVVESTRLGIELAGNPRFLQVRQDREFPQTFNFRITLAKQYRTMIKPDHWIHDFASNGGVLPFNPEQINPASYDVTLGNHWICPTRDPQEVVSDSFTLFPGEVILATTREYLKMPRDVVADLKLKSSLGRLWLNHSLSGWIDCNFEGQVTLELQNLGPYPRKLHAGMRVAQLVFLGMESPPEVAYGEQGRGHYQGQKGATPAWTDEFFPVVDEGNTSK